MEVERRGNTGGYGGFFEKERERERERRRVRKNKRRR